MLRRKPTEVLWTSEQWLRLLSPQGDRYTSTHTQGSGNTVAEDQKGCWEVLSSGHGMAVALTTSL